MKHLFNSIQYYGALFIISSFIFSSCLKDYDLGNLEVEWTPEVIVPLAHGTFVMDDILDLVYDDTLYLRANEDSLLHVFYRQDSVYYVKARDLVDFPENFNLAGKVFEIGDFPLPDYTFRTSHTLRQLLIEEYEYEPTYVENLQGTQFIFDTFQGKLNTEFTLENVAFEEIEYADISSADIQIEVSNNYPLKLTFTGEVYDEINQNLVADVEIAELMPGEKRTLTVPINNKRISSQLIGRTSNATVFGSETPVTVDLSSSLDIKITITNIKLKQGKGIIPAVEISNHDYMEAVIRDGYEITGALTNKAEFELTLSTNLPVGGSVEVIFPGFTQNGIPKTISIPFNAYQKNIQYAFNLNNHLLSFQGEAPGSFNLLELSYALHLEKSENAVTLKNTDNISINLQAKNLNLVYLEGFVGEREVELNKGVAEFPSDFWQKLEGTLHFADPRIHFLIENSIGIPNQFIVNFNGINQNGEHVSLDPPLFSAPYPEIGINTPVTEKFTVDKNNSNIINFISLPPDMAVEYSANILLNPGLKSTVQPSRIYADSYLKLGYEVEIPMQLSTTGIRFTQAFNLDSIVITGLQSGMLRIKYANHIPLAFAIQTSFRDSVSNQVLNALEPFTIQPAKTDASGKSIESTVDFVEIELSETFSETLDGANQLFVSGTFITPKEGLEEVKLYLNDFLDLKFILSAKLDLAGGLNND